MELVGNVNVNASGRSIYCLRRSPDRLWLHQLRLFAHQDERARTLAVVTKHSFTDDRLGTNLDLKANDTHWDIDLIDCRRLLVGTHHFVRYSGFYEHRRSGFSFLILRPMLGFLPQRNVSRL